MLRLCLVLSLLLALPALAQTEIPCTSGCPARRYFERVSTCPGGVCTRATPLVADFSGGTKGLGLSAMAGAILTVCAEPGYLLSGSGTVRFWLWAPWPDTSAALLSFTRALDKSIASATNGTECTGGIACRCVHFEDAPTAGGALSSNRRVIAQPIGVEVVAGVGADGTPTLETYFVGLERQ